MSNSIEKEGECFIQREQQVHSLRECELNNGLECQVCGGEGGSSM